ncbi:hypothetical protein BH09VER1_BH09VER1_40500 [soil metagenome]
MKLKVFPLFVFLAVANFGRADQLDDRLKDLRQSVTAEIDALNKKSENSQDRQAAMQAQQILEVMSVVEQTTAGQRSEDLRYVRQQIASLQFSKDLQAKFAAFFEQFGELQKKRAKDYLSNVENTLSAAREAILKAKKPGDLDDILGEIDSLGGRRGGDGSTLAREAAEKLQAATATITTWQKYLQTAESGYPDAAQNNLRQLLERQTDYPLLNAEVIKSELAKLQKNKAAPSNEVSLILDSVKQASDIPPAAKSLANIDSDTRNQGTIQFASQRMQGFARIYAAAVYGFQENISDSYSSDSANPFTTDLLRIESLLRLELLSRAFAKLKVDPPKPGENFEDYTNRLLEAAVQAKDWDTAESILKVSTKSFGRQQTNATFSSLLGGIQAFNSGKKLENAGQFAAAIQAYRKVLTTSGPYLPVNEATERLRVLTDQHKDAVAQLDKEEEIRSLVKSVLESSPRRPYPPY